MWKLPGPKIELMPPTLIGGILVAVPPRKSSSNFLIRILLIFVEKVNLSHYTPEEQFGLITNKLIKS